MGNNSGTKLFKITYMSTISGHITLSKLVSKVIEVQGKSSMVKGIFIPIENNDLYFNEKTGQVELNIIGYDFTPKNDSRDTHIVKQSISKDKRNLLTDEDKKKMPIIGNLSVWEVRDELQDIEKQTFPEPDDLPF